MIDTPVQYKTIYNTIDNFFLPHAELLSKLNITTDKARLSFYYRYFDKWTIFDNAEIQDIVNQLFIENTYKYNTLIGTLNLEYNPIENYNMTETGTDERTPNITRSHTNSDTMTNGGTIKVETMETETPDTTITTNNPEVVQTVAPSADFTETTTHQTTTYETDAFTDSTKDIKTQTGNSTTTTGANTLTTTQSGSTTAESSSTTTDTTTHTNSGSGSSTETGNETTEHSLSRSGNIGVTTTQQMIESERNIAAINVFDIICKDISEKIFLQVW